MQREESYKNCIIQMGSHQGRMAFKVLEMNAYGVSRPGKMKVRRHQYCSSLEGGLEKAKRYVDRMIPWMESPHNKNKGGR